MNKLNFLLCMFLLLAMVACSSKSSNEDGTEAAVGAADGQQDDVEALEIAEDDIKMEDVNGSVQQTAVAAPEAISKSEEMATLPEDHEVKTAGIEYYEVQSGDTLMLIAFKIYGDYIKWKDLARLNANQLKVEHNVVKGMKIKYEVPASRFTWQPNGDPYLILRGDTLGKISNKLYSTPKHWKDLWDNNKPMIKSPSLIFAGFTLYYLPLRDLASR